MLDFNDPNLYKKYKNTSKFIKKEYDLDTYLVNRFSSFYLRYLNLCNLKEDYNYVFQTRFDFDNNIDFSKIINIDKENYILAYYPIWGNEKHTLTNFKNNREITICDESLTIFKNVDIEKIKYIFNPDTWINNIKYMNDNNLFDYYQKFNPNVHRFTQILGHEVQWSINLNECELDKILIPLGKYHPRKTYRI